MTQPRDYTDAELLAIATAIGDAVAAGQRPEDTDTAALVADALSHTDPDPFRASMLLRGHEIAYEDDEIVLWRE